MPAAAVIPAPIAYTNIAVVKTLVVGSRPGPGGPRSSRYLLPVLTLGAVDNESGVSLGALHRVSWVAGTFTLNKLECFKQAHPARIYQHGIMKKDLGSILLVFGIPR